MFDDDDDDDDDDLRDTITAATTMPPHSNRQHTVPSTPAMIAVVLLSPSSWFESTSGDKNTFVVCVCACGPFFANAKLQKQKILQQTFYY